MTPSDERFESLDLLGKRLTEAASREIPTTRKPPKRRWIAVPILVAAVTGFAFTAPGRAVTDDLAELVGIGEVGGAPTQPSEVGDFDPASDQIVLATGTTANGDPYEIVAFRSNRLIKEGSDSICVNVEFLERASGRAGSCYAGALNYGGMCCAGVTAKDEPGFVPEVVGQIRPGISRVQVEYVDEAGETKSAEADIGMITPEFAERLEVDHPSGLFIASLPGLATETVEPYPPGPADPVTVSVFDESGERVETETIRSDTNDLKDAVERRQLWEEYVACAKELGSEDPTCVAIRDQVAGDTT